MWFSLPVLLLAACLADGTQTEESVKASKLASLRFRRVVGGYRAPHVPWQAMVYLSEDVTGGGYAGGALINDRWILTAGRNLFVKKRKQEINGKDPVIPKVYLGITDLTEVVASKQVAVEKVVLHPRFQNRSDWDNDLALIQLKQPVVMSDKVTPIPLPEIGQDLEDVVGGSGVITGWGWQITMSPSRTLRYLILPLLNKTRCEAEYERITYTPAVDDETFCTGTDGQNVCFSDAGGALAVTDAETGDIYAAGILSYDNCCNRFRNGIYMKITSYLPWIHSVIRGDTEQSSALRSEAMAKMQTLQSFD